MKFTKRESVLLITLLIFALLFIEYQLVFLPGLKRYDELIAQDEKVQSEVDEINRLISSIPKIKARKDATLSEIENVGQQFYDQLDTAALLWSTHDLMTKSGLILNAYDTSDLNIISIDANNNEINKMTYQLKSLADDYANAATPSLKPSPTPTPKPSSSGTEDTSSELEAYSINIDYSGSYDQIRQFISSLESLNKTITVSMLAINNTETPGIISGQVLINYYGVKKIIQQSDPENSWQLPAYSSGSGTPFASGIASPSPMPDQTDIP